MERRVLMDAVPFHGDTISTATPVSLARLEPALQQEAGRLLSGSTVAGAIWDERYTADPTFAKKDVDMFRVDLAAGDLLDVDVDSYGIDFGSGPSVLDSKVRIFDASGNELTWDDDTHDADGNIVNFDPDLFDFVAPDAGAYYVGIAVFDHGYNANPRFPVEEPIDQDPQEYRMTFTRSVVDHHPTVVPGGSNGTETDAADQRVTWQVTDADDDLLSVSATVSRDGVTLLTSGDAAGAFDFNGFGLGTFDVVVTARDWTADGTVIATRRVVVNDDDLEPPQIATGGSSGSESHGLEQALTWSVTGAAVGGTLVTLTRDGVAVGGSTSDAGEFDLDALGLGTFELVVTSSDDDNDWAGDAASATASRSVAVTNAAPVAAADGYVGDEDQTLTVVAPGVLGNDSDADGDGLSAVLVAGPAHGSLTLNADGSFEYAPAANYHGPDSFMYLAYDGVVGSEVAVVSITVTGLNDAPVALADAASTAEDAPASGNVLANDFDVDHGAGGVTAQLLSGPLHGTLTLNPDGNFVYTPRADYFGADRFTYRAVDGDGAASAEAVVSLAVSEVNDAPVAYGDEGDATPAEPLVGNVLPNDVDPDNEDGLLGNDDTLSAVLVAGPSNGILTLGADGRFTYTPDAGFFGTDTFTYRAVDQDGAESAVATVTITVESQSEPEPEPGTIELVADATQPGLTALLIHGSAASEIIAVAPAPGGVEVYFGIKSQGVFGPTGRIVIYGRAGNDAVLIAGSVGNSVWAYGDEGDDVIKLGNGGGIAFGGAGNDAIVGGSGRDMMIGGEGADHLVGNPGDDVLLAALTTHDDRFANASHEDAWAKMQAEWRSGRTFGERVGNLRNGTGSASRANGSYFLDDQTVSDDLAVDGIDVLTGSAGNDWIISKFGEDRVNGLSSTEACYDVDIG